MFDVDMLTHPGVLLLVSLISAVAGAVAREVFRRPDLASCLEQLEREVRALRPRDVRPIALKEPKPHRHQWIFRSEEETNKIKRRIHVCAVVDCHDTYVKETPQQEGASG